MKHVEKLVKFEILHFDLGEKHESMKMLITKFGPVEHTPAQINAYP